MYATLTELADYLGTDPPDNADKLIRDASTLIDYATMGRIDPTEHADTARDAVCAQVEYWLELGPEYGVTGPVAGFSIGSLTINGAYPQLAPRARQILLPAGLLYRGV